MLLQENTIFDKRYQLIRLLGRGGFSEVWLAKDSYTKLDIALKVYAPGQGMDSDGLSEFSAELAGVFNLNHTNLLKPTHVDAWEGMPYLIMPFCSHGSIVKRVGEMQEDEIWKLIHDVASGLAYLHKNDIVHQDIKPDNILLDDNGNYVITDFGISTKARSTLRKSAIGGAVSGGTMAYMGPERFSKQPAPTKASDIWSFGAMVYELITGNVPFGEMGGGMQKGGAEIPEINEPISDTLRQTIESMLALETWDRPTAEELAESAQKYLHKSRNQQPYGDDSLTGEEGNTNGGGRPTVGFPTEPPTGGDQTSGGENKWKYVAIISVLLIVAAIVTYLCVRPVYYSVQFLNYDNTVLAKAMVKEGSKPHYNGTTPVKPSDGQYSYLFAGWSPNISSVNKNTTYKAQYHISAYIGKPVVEEEPKVSVEVKEKPINRGVKPTPKLLDGFKDITYDRRTPVNGIPGGYVNTGDRIRGRFENGRLVQGTWYKHDGPPKYIYNGSEE